METYVGACASARATGREPEVGQAAYVRASWENDAVTARAQVSRGGMRAVGDLYIYPECAKRQTDGVSLVSL